ncbi:MAG: hypothetical protein AB9880_00020 [Christensenellales bacterium]
MEDYRRPEGDDAGIFTEMERDAKIKKELTRLRKLLADIAPDTGKLMEGLVHDAAFMSVTLEEARLIIMRDGIIETYQNGANQTGRKKSSAAGSLRQNGQYLREGHQTNLRRPATGRREQCG